MSGRKPIHINLRDVKGDLSVGNFWSQHQITLSPKPRGFHLIDDELKPYYDAICGIEMGVVYLFLLHTSASILINENACRDVRVDLENYFNQLAPENVSYYTHTQEGADDMPAHIKTSLLGNLLTIPITDGKMVLGTCQGIYLCEHRNQAQSRKLIMTINGNRRD